MFSELHNITELDFYVYIIPYFKSREWKTIYKFNIWHQKEQSNINF